MAGMSTTNCLPVTAVFASGAAAGRTGSARLRFAGTIVVLAGC